MFLNTHLSVRVKNGLTQQRTVELMSVSRRWEMEERSRAERGGEDAELWKERRSLIEREERERERKWGKEVEKEGKIKIETEKRRGDWPKGSEIVKNERGKAGVQNKKDRMDRNTGEHKRKGRRRREKTETWLQGRTNGEEQNKHGHEEEGEMKDMQMMIKKSAE